MIRSGSTNINHPRERLEVYNFSGLWPWQHNYAPSSVMTTKDAAHIWAGTMAGNSNPDQLAKAILKETKKYDEED